MSQGAPTALYRYFDDKGRLLYVGITGGNPSRREDGHARSPFWMQLAASSTIERHPERVKALVAERAAIKAERPLFNRQYNDTTAARERVKAYLEEIGRMDLYDPQRYAGTVPLGELEMMRARKRKPTAKPTGRATGDDWAQIIPDARFRVVPIAIPALQDDRLSLAACGLLALSMAIPAGAKFTTEQLASQRPDSHDDILAALAELAEHGYFRDGVISDGKVLEDREFPT
jgi:AcrR family transcriptional regulator